MHMGLYMGLLLHSQACLIDLSMSVMLLQVKNFCNEEVESNKLGTAITNYQKAEYTMVISFNVISLLQGTIVFSATVLGLVLCVKVSAVAFSTLASFGNKQLSWTHRNGGPARVLCPLKLPSTGILSPSDSQQLQGVFLMQD